MTKLFVAGALLATMCGPQQPGRGGDDPRDVTGNYDLTYDDHLRLQLNIGGAVREVEQDGYGAIVDFGMYNGQPVRLDLREFCGKPDVKCPSESFWAKVAIDQPQLDNNGFDLQELRVINDEVHVLDAGQKAASITGLVDHGNDDRYLIGLGIGGGATQNCAAIDVSFTHGRFSRTGEKMTTSMEHRDQNGKACNPDAGTPASDAGMGGDAGVMTVCALKPVTRLTYPDGAKVDGIKDGKIGLAWAGGCAFGPVLVGATLYLETGYTARRTGDFDPPPFTSAPVTQPDGGFPVDDGGSPDAG